MTYGVNVSGWEYLMNGSLIQAAYSMYSIDMGGWAIGILFVVYQFMLYIKTKNLTLCVITTFFFCMIGFSALYLTKWSQVIIVSTLIIEVAGILYLWLFGDTA